MQRECARALTFQNFCLGRQVRPPGAAARPLTRRRACRRAGVTFSATPRLQTLTAQSAPAAVATSAARGYHVPGGRGQGRGGGGGRRGRGGGRGKYGGNLVMRATSTRDRWRQGRGGGSRRRRQKTGTRKRWRQGRVVDDATGCITEHASMCTHAGVLSLPVLLSLARSRVLSLFLLSLSRSAS
jgi:hypothetical protein